VEARELTEADRPAAVAFYEHLAYEDQHTTVLARWLT
jgi:hypothetical protein